MKIFEDLWKTRNFPFCIFSKIFEKMWKKILKKSKKNAKWEIRYFFIVSKTWSRVISTTTCAVSRASACSCVCLSLPCFVQFMKLWYVIYEDNFFLSHEKLYSHPYIDKWRYVSKIFYLCLKKFSHADEGRKWMTRMDDWWKWMTPWMTPHLYTIWSWMTPKIFVYYIVLICSQIFHSSSLAWMTMDDFWMTRHPCPFPLEKL